MQGTHTEYIKALCKNCQETAVAAKILLPASPTETMPQTPEPTTISRRSSSSDIPQDENEAETKKFTTRTWEIAHGKSKVSEAWWENILERFGEWLEAGDSEMIMPDWTNDALIDNGVRGNPSGT